MGRADLTVLAIPGFLGAMAAEYTWQRRHPGRPGDARPGDYELRDTLTSLSMGLASLVAPYAMKRLLDPVTPGVGRLAKVLLGGTVAGAAATTVADIARLRRTTGLPQAGVIPGGRPTSAWSGASAVAAVGGTALAAATTWSTVTSGQRLFARHGRDLGGGPLVSALAVLGWDAIYYWNHRLSHESRWLWAVHVVHHSSERYNLSTALRQPVFEGVTMGVPYGLLALAGIRPAVIENARALNLLYQFWIHTEAIPRLGPLEKVLNTPSHHRVHHGSNRRYLDRNHGSILIVWDRLFGTFEPEGERVVYGLTRNIDTFDPRRVLTHEWCDLARDIARSTTWADRFGFLLRGPGWADRRRAELAGLGRP